MALQNPNALNAKKDGLGEIIQTVKEAKSVNEKIKILQANDSRELRGIFELAYDNRLKWALPEGTPPYKPLDKSFDNQGMLHTEMRRMYIFLEGKANMTFTVPRDDVLRAEEAVQSAFAEDSSETKFESSDIAIVSIVGVGMRSHSGVAATLFDALADNGINIQLVSTSEIKISVGINPDSAEDSTRIIHKAFGLDAQS